MSTKNGLIDHIGTNLVSIRQGPNGGVTISVLSGGIKPLGLTSEEWFDLCGLVLALKAGVDFADEYHPEP